MSVVGWKKKKQLIWVLSGAAFAGIPLLAGVLILAFTQVDLRREVKTYKQKVEQHTFGRAYCLKTGKSSEDVIKESDLTQMTLAAEGEEEIPEAELEELVGKYCKTALAKGSIVTEDLLSDAEIAGNDMRRNTFTQITYSHALSKGEYVDIRISFPTGEDYIVARHKQLLALGTEEDEGSYLTFTVSEAELLRLSSAFVDAGRYEGTSIYAIAYLDSFQGMAQVTYPMNPQVYTLLGWDPNVTEPGGVEEAGISQEENRLRETLEKNLSAYIQEEAFEEASKPAEETETSDLEAADSDDGMKEFFPQE